MKTIAILADKYDASTGFAVVCRNLANELSRWFRVIYFGRYGQDKEFALETTVPRTEMFEYVPTQGGVWDRELVNRILLHYTDIDYVFSEDDWYSAYGLIGACTFHNKPFHFLTPIDSLPIHPRAFIDIFTMCEKLYVPNRSYEKFNGRKRLKFGGVAPMIERQGPTLKTIHLPHGIDTSIFYPKKVDRDEEFTFMWIGRIEPRKAPGRAILAFEQVCDKMDARMLMRSDWTTPLGHRISQYILKKNLPITMDQMADIPHKDMVDVYNKGDINICTPKAGGFEMSVTEAAACGLPSLVTDWTFMNENVIHGKSGYLIPVESFCNPPPAYNPLGQDRIWGNMSIDKLAELMYQCYLNQRQVKAMGRWARGYVKDTYDWAKVAETLKSEILL